MIIGHGIDIVDVERFGKQLGKAPSLRERLFVPAERTLNVRSLAARFAAKEAVAKALGAPAGMNWQDVWIAVTAHGTPYIEVKNTVAAEAERQGVGRWHLSISHDGNNAIASVIAEQ